MSDKKQVWAIQHIGYEDLGSFEPVLKERGFEVTYFCSRNVDYKAMFAGDPDLIIDLGGPMHVYDRDKNPWIDAEIQFIAERIETEKPLIGICFGAQVIARALGANVYAGEQGKEIGWSNITVNDDGKKTPFRHLDSEYTNMLHWHTDTFDMPDGVVILASSDQYMKQAFSYGDHVMAMQCHPEVTPKKLNLWYASNIEDINDTGQNVDEMKKQADAYNKKLSTQATLFLNEWLDEQGL